MNIKHSIFTKDVEYFIYYHYKYFIENTIPFLNIDINFPVNINTFLSAISSSLIIICLVLIYLQFKTNEDVIELLAMVCLARLLFDIADIFLYYKPLKECLEYNTELNNLVYNNLDDKLMNQLLIKGTIVSDPLGAFIKYLANSDETLDSQKALFTYSFIDNLSSSAFSEAKRKVFIDSYLYGSKIDVIVFIKELNFTLLTELNEDKFRDLLRKALTHNNLSVANANKIQSADFTFITHSTGNIDIAVSTIIRNIKNNKSWIIWKIVRDIIVSVVVLYFVYYMRLNDKREYNIFDCFNT